MSSENRFGFEWKTYNYIDLNYEAQFINWISPLTPADLKDKRILDAGCGMGRNSYWCLKYGAKEVYSFDYNHHSLDAAKENLKDFPNSHISFQSIYDIKWENHFDIAFSIGVIHHLENPGLAIKNLIRSLKKGGTLLIWVYSYEGNEWITKFVDPIRKNITSKLPVQLVHFLSYFCSVPLWIIVKIFRGPSQYLKQLSTFDFFHIHSIVFDQLIPTTANYWKKSEVLDLLNTQNNLTDINAYRPKNDCGWTAIGIKK